MSVASSVANGLLALGMAWCAYAEFTRFGEIPQLMARARVPVAWLPWLATAKVLALLGLIVGLWLPPIGTITALAVAVYFVAALVTHVTARDSNVVGAAFFLVLSCATLGLRLATSAAFAF